METTATTSNDSAAPPFPRWRTITTWVLLVIFCLGVVLSGVTTWATNQVLDTDAYVETVTPLASDPDIQLAIASRVTTLIGEFIERDDVLAGSADGVVRQMAMPMVLEFVHRTVLDYMQSPEFEEFWVSANARAHEGFLSALTGDAERSLTVQEGELILDLSPLITQVNERLQASGLEAVHGFQVDPARATFVLFESEEVAALQQALPLLDSLAIVLPVITLIALAGCLLLAQDRWATAMWAALGVAMGMVLLVIGLRIARDVILDGLPPERSAAAVASVLAITTRDLRDGARLISLLALLVAGGCGIAGSSWVRQPRVVTFVMSNRALLLGGITAVACIALMVEEMSLQMAMGVGIAALAGVLGVTWLSRLPVPDLASDGAAPHLDSLPEHTA